jgi:hypothetical protein
MAFWGGQIRKRGRMRLRDSQVVEREELRDTAKDHKHGNREVHHATVHCQLLPALPMLRPEASAQLRRASCGALTRCRRSPWRIDWRGVGTAA